MPIISIVTPAYNVATFIAKTYECLARQNYDNWEWVVVDDGSTDDTPDILDNIAASDKRVRVFHQTNSGSAKYPRDRAVYESTGSLILMLDADDTIDDDYLQVMLARMEETQADIIYPTTDFILQNKCINTLPLPSIDTTKIYKGRDVVRMTIPNWQIGCNGGLYKRHVWVNMSYPQYEGGKILMNTDELDERLYQLTAEKVAFAKTRYSYILHPESITNSINWKRFDILQTNRQLLRIIDKEFGTDSIEHRLMKKKIRNDKLYALRLILSFIKKTLKIHTLVKLFKREN